MSEFGKTIKALKEANRSGRVKQIEVRAVNKKDEGNPITGTAIIFWVSEHK